LATATFLAPLGISDLILVFLLFVNQGQFYRKRAVETEYDLFGMKRVVIVLVVRILHPRRDITVLEKFGEPGQRLDHRFAHLRVVIMQSAVRCDQVLAPVGDHMRVERGQRVDPVRADFQTEGINVTHPLAAQLGLLASAGRTR
jgi:hypothetical protein